MSNHLVVYIPGILDDIAYVQSNLVRLWRLQDVKGVTHVMPWLGEGSYRDKEQQLIDRIKQAQQKGQTVSLVGASAGATAAINVFYKYPDLIKRVVLICPKVNNSRNISSKMISKNPAFLKSIQELELVIDTITDEQKKKITSFISPRDGLVSYVDSAIPGVLEVELPPLRHNAAIVYAISFGFAKLKPKLI